MKQTWQQMLAKVDELGGFTDDGMNWHFAFFDTIEAARQFHEWLDSGWQTRGYSDATSKELGCVRFRRD